jgi:glycogen synthase
MNGIDLSVWDPSRDPFLPLAARYGPETVDEGKARAKLILQVGHGQIF